MLRLYQSLNEVKPCSVRDFFGLAAMQVRRTLLDLVRHHFGPQGAAAKHDSDIACRSDSRGAIDPQAGPQTLVEWEQFHRMIEQLPQEEQEVFTLVWYGGMNQNEAAAVLQISKRTMIRRMNRARMLIFEFMNGEQPNLSDT